MVSSDEVSPRWAAKKLGRPVRTIWRWCREQRLHVRQDTAGRYWLRRDEVEAIAANPSNWRTMMRTG